MNKIIVAIIISVLFGCSKEQEVNSLTVEGNAQIEKAYVKISKGSKVTFKTLDKNSGSSVLEYYDDNRLEFNGKYLHPDFNSTKTFCVEFDRVGKISIEKCN